MSQPNRIGSQGNGQGGPGAVDPGVIDPEVVPKVSRRRFNAEYKLGVLREADGCSGPGQIGALLRREGLYSSHLANWRHDRDTGALKALAPKRRGRKPSPETRIVELQRENARLAARLEQAELIIDAQKKLCAIFGSERTETLTKTLAR